MHTEGVGAVRGGRRSPGFFNTLAAPIERHRLRRRLIELLNSSFTTSDSFFVEVVNRASLRIDRDDFPSEITKHSLILKVVQHAIGGGWFVTLLDAIDEKLHQDQADAGAGRITGMAIVGQRAVELKEVVAQLRALGEEPLTTHRPQRLALLLVPIAICGLIYLAWPRNLLLPPDIAEFRVSRCDENALFSNVAVTLNVKYRKPTFWQGKFVEKESLRLRYLDRNIEFYSARLVERIEKKEYANCLGEKGSVGTFELTGTTDGERLVMYFQSRADGLAWSSFVNDLHSKNIGFLDLELVSTVSGRRMQRVCRLEGEYLKKDLARKINEREARGGMVWWLQGPCENT